MFCMQMMIGIVGLSSIVLFRHRLGDTMTIGSDSFGLVRAHRLSLVSLFKFHVPTLCRPSQLLYYCCEFSERLWFKRVNFCRYLCSIVSNSAGWLVLIRIIIVTHCGFVNTSVERAKRSFFRELYTRIYLRIPQHLQRITILLLLFY